jgi:hypothetical protein
MSKEEYIYQNFVFQDHPRDGEATYQSDSQKTRLLKSRWEFVDEIITVKGNNFVAILKMRKKKIFFELEEITDFTKVLFSSQRINEDFKEFKKYCDVKTYRKYLEKDFSKTENIVDIASYCYHKLHKIIEKFENMKQEIYSL